MKCSKFVEKHRCALKLDSESEIGLPQLKPNASWLEKFLRQLWKYIMVSKSHPYTRIYFSSKLSRQNERIRHVKMRKFYIVHPLSIFCMVREFLMTLLWFIILICETLYSVELDLTFFHEFLKYQTLFVINMAISFFVGYIHKSTKEIVLSPKRIALHYICTFFVLDFLSINTVVISHVLLLAKLIPQGLSDFLIIFQVLAKTIRLAMYINEITALTSFRLKLSYTFITVTGSIIKTIIMVYILSFITLIWCFITRTVFGKYNFFSFLDQQEIPHTIGDYYREGILLTLCIFFSNGEVYYDPYSSFEKTLYFLLHVLSVFFFAYLIICVYEISNIHSSVSNKFENTKKELEVYMVQKKFPNFLKKRVQKFFSQSSSIGEELILETLSPHLHHEVLLFTSLEMIHYSPFFRKMPRKIIGRMLSYMRREVHQPGDVLFRAGQRGDTMYLIDHGGVACYTAAGAEFFHLEDGEVFGIYCALYKESGRLFSTVCVDVTTVYSLTGEELEECIKLHPQVKYRVIRNCNDQITKLRCMMAEREI